VSSSLPDLIRQSIILRKTFFDGRAGQARG
jgi:hypothetical protein